MGGPRDHIGRDWIVPIGPELQKLTQGTPDTLEQQLEEFHDRRIAERMQREESRTSATLIVENQEVARYTTLSGRESWKLNRKLLPEFMEFNAHESQWVASSAGQRLSKLGITANSDTVEQTIARLCRQTIRQKHREGMAEDDARRFVEHHVARRGKSIYGNPIWQIHISAIPQLSESIADWVSLRMAMGKFGVTSGPRIREASSIISEYLPKLNARVMQIENLS